MKELSIALAERYYKQTTYII